MDFTELVQKLQIDQPVLVYLTRELEQSVSNPKSVNRENQKIFEFTLTVAKDSNLVSRTTDYLLIIDEKTVHYEHILLRRQQYLDQHAAEAQKDQIAAFLKILRNFNDQ